MATLTEQLSAPPEMMVPTLATSPAAPVLAVSAPPPAATDEFSAFEDAPVDEFAAFEDASDEFSNFPDADDLDIKTVEDLNADRDNFSPKEYYAANPDVASDPKKLAKLLDVYRRRDKEGLAPGQVAKAAVTEALPTVGKILGGARDLAKAGVELAVQPFATAVGSVLTGDIFDHNRREPLFAEQRDRMKKAVAEGAAASETSATGLADLARTGLRKFASRDSTMGLQGTGLAKEDITGAPKPEKTDQELLQQIAADVEFGKQLSEVAQGRGETLKEFGLDADTLKAQGITLDPGTIERLSLVDPLTLVATGGIFKGVSLGKTIFTAASRAAAEETLAKLAARAAQVVTSPARAAGATVQLAGAAAKKIAPLAPTIGAGIGAASGGMSAAGGYFAGKAAQRILPKVGTALEATGRGVSNIANKAAQSTTFQKALVGAGEGALAAAPIAAASDDDQTAGAILGAGVILGGGIRGVVEAKQNVGRVIAKEKLAPSDVPYAPTESKPYGQNENLDVAHTAAISALPETSRNQINAFRETVRDLGGEVYVLEPEVFQQSLLEHAERAKGEPLTGPEVDAVRAQADQQGGYFDTTLPGERRAIFLNNAANPVAHETGHLFFDLLTPERQADLVQTARDVYTPEQIAEFKQNYERQFGEPVTEDRALNELIQENFGLLFRNTPIGELSTPPRLMQKIGNQVVNFAESLGLDLTAGTRTELGGQTSLRFNDAVREAAREVLGMREQQPAAAPVVEPVSRATARPEPVSIAEAARTLSELPDPTREIPTVATAENTPGVSRKSSTATPKLAPEPKGVPEVAAAEEARAIAAAAPEFPEVRGTKSPRELLGTIAEAIAKEEGVKLNYLSAPDEPAASISSNRDIRRDVIELNRDSPPARRKLWEKNFVPDKVIKTKAGKYQIQGLAPEVFASNAHKMAKFMSDTPDAALLSPYPIDPKTKTFTDAGWKQLFDAAQTVSYNHSRGYTGAGEPLVVPRSVTEAGGYAPPIKGNAKLLPQAEADFVNLLFNFRLPDTPRVSAGKRPLNIQGQDVSAATKPGRIRKPVQAREKFSGPEAEAQNISGREILEVNPLRNQFEAVAQRAGVPMPSLIEAIQRLNLERIKEVAGTPELPAFRANTLTAAAGFQPKISAAEVRAMTPDEFKQATTTFTGKYGSGLTGMALELGANTADAPGLVQLQGGLIDARQKVLSAKAAMDLDTMFFETGKAGFFQEALEAATGGNSEKFIQKNFDPDFQSPMKPEALTEGVKFQPKPSPQASSAKPVAKPFVPMPAADAEQIADAIYVAEGGAKARKPYGVLSVKVGSKSEARKIALRTIQNNYKRWHDAGRPGDYLEFLASKYAPANAANDPTGLNKNWLKNVRAGVKNKTYGK